MQRKNGEAAPHSCRTADGAAVRVWLWHRLLQQLSDKLAESLKVPLSLKRTKPGGRTKGGGPSSPKALLRMRGMGGWGEGLVALPWHLEMMFQHAVVHRVGGRPRQPQREEEPFADAC